MRVLAICPRIRKRDGCIVASTAWRVRLLSLGTVYRQVVIDPGCETLSIHSRYLWLIRLQRTVPFSQVRAITYGYQDTSAGSAFSYAHDSFDTFTVGLRLSDDSEKHLFSFIGEGTFSNNGPFPDWMYWDQFVFDISGSQENESRVFVELLSKMIGVSVVPPRLY